MFGRLKSRFEGRVSGRAGAGSAAVLRPYATITCMNAVLLFLESAENEKTQDGMSAARGSKQRERVTCNEKRLHDGADRIVFWSWATTESSGQGHPGKTKENRHGK